MASEVTIAEIEREITALGYGTPEYHEAMAMYCMTLARGQWRMADTARRRQIRQDVKEQARRKGEPLVREESR